MVQQSGWSATTLHSDKTQTQREAALQQLRDGEVQALVATDVAGRGLDVPDVCECCYQALSSQQTPTTFSPSPCSNFPLSYHIPTRVSSSYIYQLSSPYPVRYHGLDRTRNETNGLHNATALHFPRHRFCHCYLGAQLTLSACSQLADGG